MDTARMWATRVISISQSIGSLFTAETQKTQVQEKRDVRKCLGTGGFTNNHNGGSEVEE